MATSLAEGHRVSAVSRDQNLAARRSLTAMFGLRLSDIGHGWDGLPGHAQAPDDVVSRDVVHHQPKERRQCAGYAASVGVKELPDRLGMASQIAARDGAGLGGTA